MEEAVRLWNFDYPIEEQKAQRRELKNKPELIKESASEMEVVEIKPEQIVENEAPSIAEIEPEPIIQQPIEPTPPALIEKPATDPQPNAPTSAENQKALADLDALSKSITESLANLAK